MTTPTNTPTNAQVLEKWMTKLRTDVQNVTCEFTDIYLTHNQMKRTGPNVLTLIIEGDMLYVKTDEELLQEMEKQYRELIQRLHPE